MKSFFLNSAIMALIVAPVAASAQTTFTARGHVGDSNTSEAAVTRMNEISTILNARIDEVEPFAKTALPVCDDGEYLTSDGKNLKCATASKQKYAVTCTSKAGRTRTVTGEGAEGAPIVARAPSGDSVWVVLPSGPHLNCFEGYVPRDAMSLDFQNEKACKEHAGVPGYGRYLQSCAWKQK
ncbi:hypothetical protein [Amorphus sp. 3PC139-8]|uniref:hypothetical protein n=1 Tax=Amorphus sp. 3PC139-8 TaxID=2735676 RepID=UPI00345D2C03